MKGHFGETFAERTREKNKNLISSWDRYRRLATAKEVVRLQVPQNARNLLTRKVL
jgi:hypothetical protein